MLLHGAIWAQQPASPPAPDSTHIIMIGTGGGPPIRLKRAEPSTLLVVGGRRYLIDVGVGSLHNLVAAGYHASDIDAVLITHHHLDHDGGLADLISYSSWEARQREVQIVGPYGTVEMVQAAITYGAASRRIFGAEGLKMPDPSNIYKGRDIPGPGVVFEDGVIKVTAVENSHYQTIPSGSLSDGLDKSYSYRVETPGRTVVFTGDTGPSEQLVNLAEGADVLVSEVIDVPASIEFAISQTAGLAHARAAVEAHMQKEHLAPEEVGKLAARAHVKMVILNHLSPGRDSETDFVMYSNGVQKFYHGPVVVSHDLQQF